MSHVIRIGRYDVVDAEMDAAGASSNATNEVHIPCLTNPGLSYQLDGWDEDTSVPAWIDGKRVELKIGHYDKNHHHWVLKIPA
ncbi:hypothetical protein BL250_03795 [Erwinia sp. OLTSP20]|uniref:DUF1480 family protein n=1 Tax=unclassified Erwinia TaxID=2622719 RepID=UPI000C19A6C7|nr:MULTISPECIES: DUF1480 family protein [unclassified Erwinia]PIJ51625.1 hypothetical protein BV501_02725 [Erwinia sp. OAMSP11]PIJ69702.1 hypothetical protein BK416_13980 [Erwinia sp. OLSSP12]PIJ79425.1 hypothetical protein BLD47_14060 [Erwinia sp. OLCASP19]PIJ86595.1 hypothetical protein BLD46_02550 [Erwinia sp. OLMTSP26]PIJ88036.1 hypothetical protein BLD49_03230 [Erwinia sp. OLMDSP33]